MAASGSISAKGSKGHHTFTLSLTEGSYDIANNTSPISYTFSLVDDNNWFWNNWGTAISYSLNIGGQTITGSIPTHSTKSETIKTGSVTITHEDDGSKTIPYSFSVSDSSGASYTSGTANSSGTLALTVIPRASSMSWSPADPTTAQTITATVTRASTSFKHTITTVYGGTTYTLGTAKFDTSTSITIPAALKTAMKNNNASSVALPVTLTTYNGDTVIGTANYTLTVKAPIATISTSASSVACNANVTWNLANVDTGICTYTVTRSYDNVIRYTDQTKATTTSKAVANATFETYIVGSASGTVTVKVTTFVGTTEVGSNTYDYTVTIPIATYKPTLAVASQLARVNKVVYTYQTGITFLAGYDGAVGTITEGRANSSHAAITNREVIITSSLTGITETHTVNGTTATISLNTFPASDTDYTVTVKYKVTDARGGTAELSFTAITVRGYSKPKINSFLVQRANSAGTVAAEGTYANITASVAAHTVKNTSNAEVNSMSSVVVTYGTATAATGTVSGLTGTVNTTKYSGSLAITSRYTFIITATDKLGLSTSATFVLEKASVTLSLHKNGGVGLGTVAEAGKVLSSLPLTVIDNPTIANTFTPVHVSTLSGSSVNGKYIKISINSTKAWMLAFTVQIYAQYQQKQIRISGYQYGTNHWYSPRAEMISSSDNITETVSFGYDSDAHLWVCIPIYRYYGVNIVDVCNGYYQVVEDSGSLFTLTQVDAVPETLQTTVTTTARVLGVKGNSESTYRTGNVNITKANIGLGNVENKSSATIRSEITSSNVTTALGFTPAHEASAIWAKPTAGYNLAKSGTYTVARLTAVRTKGSDLSISGGSIKCGKAGWVRVAAKAWFWGNDGNGNNASGGADQWITKNGTKLEDSKQRFAYAINYCIYSEALINVAANDLIGFTYTEVSGSTRSGLQTSSSYICEYIE